MDLDNSRFCFSIRQTHSGLPSAIKLNPHSKRYFATAGRDGTVKVWDMNEFIESISDSMEYNDE